MSHLTIMEKEWLHALRISLSRQVFLICSVSNCMHLPSFRLKICVLCDLQFSFQMQVWDQDEQGTWTLTASWKAHSGSVWKVTWAHPEFGQVLATCSFDRTAAIWEEISNTVYSCSYI